MSNSDFHQSVILYKHIGDQVTDVKDVWRPACLLFYSL